MHILHQLCGDTILRSAVREGKFYLLYLLCTLLPYRCIPYSACTQYQWYSAGGK
jgi:hypothetical protein